VSALTLLATFQARPETREELARRLQEMVPLTRTEPGCLRYDLHVDREDDNRFVFVETWADEAAWGVHMDTAHVQALVTDSQRLTINGIQLVKLQPL
jgi:quinol monooxygenase YgiN